VGNLNGTPDDCVSIFVQVKRRDRHKHCGGEDDFIPGHNEWTTRRDELFNIIDFGLVNRKLFDMIAPLAIGLNRVRGKKGC
jgi:hypothetical protein